jgi:hypothetical protein
MEHEDVRVLRNLALWLVACAIVGAGFLILSIWVDWV